MDILMKKRKMDDDADTFDHSETGSFIGGISLFSTRSRQPKNGKVEVCKNYLSTAVMGIFLFIVLRESGLLDFIVTRVFTIANTKHQGIN
eukprot:CAMPEP_0194221928 /NCGR_PEP_ID=MMETSP0156-20130528/31657_1 /TAXON_ID=33649 /ORGANISM="Thalassionema nitzschioides, Strain L26-B" /LENGTH=89 /DNA_ID=CAMNT_0038952497 /DNA_START=12 /DNA_END=281 /DNA_ORIENTATION=-